MKNTRKLLIGSASIVFTLSISLFFTITADANENPEVYGPVKAATAEYDPIAEGWTDDSERGFTGKKRLNATLVDVNNPIIVNRQNSLIHSEVYGGGSGFPLIPAPTADKTKKMRRIDLPWLDFYPYSQTVMPLSDYNRAEVGIDTNIGNYFTLDDVSLGLMTAINRDLGTLEPISANHPENGSSNIVLDDTYRVYTKILSTSGRSSSSAVMYVFNAKIQGKYPIKMRITYLPSESSGIIRVMYDITNMATEPIPDLMLGFNYYVAAYQNRYSSSGNGGYSRLERTGVSYLGGNQGIYTVAHGGTYRGEFYPNLDRYGADNWKAWAEPRTDAVRTRNPELFMKGFSDSTNIDAIGDEQGGQEPKTPITTSTSTDLPILTLKWQPKTLESGATRHYVWGFGPEVTTVAPRLMIEQTEHEFEPAAAQEDNAFVDIKWRNYNSGDTTTLYYRLGEDKPWIEEKLEQYTDPKFVGLSMKHTLGLHLEAGQDYNVEIKITGTPDGGDSTIIPVHFKFKVPDPKIESKAIVKEGTKEIPNLYPGVNFSYEYSMKMLQSYSTYTNPEFTLPLNTTLIDQTSVKNIKLTKVGGETVNGTINVANGKINVKLSSSIGMNDQLKLTFDGAIKDDETLVGKSLTFQPEITGFVGALTDNRAYAIPIEEIGSLNVPITEGMADVEIRFVDETGVNKLHEPIVLSRKIGTKLDLTKEQEVLDAIKFVEGLRYELDLNKKPAGEGAVPVENGNAGYTYPFKGVLIFKSTPSTISFGVQRPSVSGTINTDDVKYDVPFVVWDNRQAKKNWRLKASLATPLTSIDGKNALPDAIRYKKSKDSVSVPLSAESLIILTQQHSAQVNEYDVSKGWESKETGLELSVYKNQIASKLGEYRTTVVWELEDVPF